jgi:hypothetical protein
MQDIEFNAVLLQKHKKQLSWSGQRSKSLRHLKQYSKHIRLDVTRNLNLTSSSSISTPQPTPTEIDGVDLVPFVCKLESSAFKQNIIITSGAFLPPLVIKCFYNTSQEDAHVGTAVISAQLSQGSSSLKNLDLLLLQGQLDVTRYDGKIVMNNVQAYGNPKDYMLQISVNSSLLSQPLVFDIPLRIETCKMSLKKLSLRGSEWPVCQDGLLSLHCLFFLLLF